MCLSHFICQINSEKSFVKSDNNLMGWQRPGLFDVRQDLLLVRRIMLTAPGHMTQSCSEQQPLFSPLILPVRFHSSPHSSPEPRSSAAAVCSSVLAVL